MALRSMILAALLVPSLACNREGEPAQVKVEMANSTSTALAEENFYVTPSHFGMQFSYGGLREDQDSSQSPIGVEALIYADKNCKTGEVTKEIDGKDYTYTAPEGTACAETYVNFARASALVNADLNAAQFPVPPGTYKYIYLCYGAAFEVAVEGHISTATEFLLDHEGQSGCVSTKLDDLEVKEGDTVTLTTTYDLSKDVVSVLPKAASSEAACKASESADYQVCVNGGAQFSVTASK